MKPRSLVFEGGSSDKFWTIRVDGASHTVHYGRRGTAGQVKTKAFASGSEAAAAAEKLVAEKVRKGYVDADAPAAVPEPVEPGPAVAAVRRAEPQTAPNPRATDDRPPIELTRAEWSLATWRDIELTPPEAEPRPFDPAVLRATLSACTAGERWARNPVPFPMTRGEAAYWLRASQGLGYRESHLSRHARILESSRELDDAAAIDLARRGYLPSGGALAALVTLLGAPATLELLLTPRAKPGNEKPAIELFAGVRAYLMPLLDDGERDRLRAYASDWVEQELQDPEYMLGDAVELAAQVGGLSELVEALCDRWPDGWFSDSTWGLGSYATIAFGVGSADRFEALVERTRMRFWTDDEVAGWLAHMELRRLDWLVTGALRVESREDAAIAVDALARRLHAVEAVPMFLELQVRSRAPSVAHRWLVEHPRQTVEGLVPFTARTGQLAEAARDELKRMARGHDRAVIEEHAATLAADERSRLQERVLDAALPSTPERERPPDWLAAADARIPGKPLPAWVDLEALPALEVEGGSLGPTHLPAVLRILRAGDPATEQLRACKGAEELAWALLSVWLRSDAPSKDKWALTALGALGRDRTATRLAPLIRAWPGEGQHKRAMAGLEVLRAIGTDVALMQLNGIAQKLKFKALKDGARQAMEEIARDKRMSKSELEDRIVPDCGLDARGTRIFDYGARRFEFVLGPGMKPMVRDAAGTVRAAPPKPGAKDDAARATAALEDWKLLRKTVADVAKVQAARLEQAMVAGRRWSGDDFMTLLAGHPLQRHLVRPLVLATYRAGAIDATFRLTEEGDLADAQDQAFALDLEARVGIVHPLDLDAGQLALWGEHLADYELVPPFPQLGRAVFDIEPGEHADPVLTRFSHAEIEPATLVRTLENLDWTRGQPEDGGVFHHHTKFFPGADCTAVVEYEHGVPTGYIHDAGPQRITRVYAVGGELDRGRLSWGRHQGDDDPIPWGAVDRVVRSEVLADLHRVVPGG